MKQLTEIHNFNKTINLALNLKNNYNKPVTFHCYWNGELNEKHLYSILSCYYFNVYKDKHKIILWIENNIPNKYNCEITKYAQIKNFVLSEEQNNTNFIKNDENFQFSGITFYSDFIRSLLLKIR